MLQARIIPRIQSDEPTYAATFQPEGFLGGEAAAGVGSFASPQALLCDHLSFLFGHAFLAFPGFGSWMTMQHGTAVVVAWPMQAVVDKHASIAAVSDMFDSLSASEAADFMKKNGSIHFPVTENHIVWLPVGWHVFVVTTSDTATLLWMPHLSRELLKETSPAMQQAILAWNEAVLQADAEGCTEDREEASHAFAALAWMKGCAEP